MPKIAGRPTGGLVKAGIPELLRVGLCQSELQYAPLVEAGQSVQYGQALARVEVDGGALALPAPASGTVASVDAQAGFIALNEIGPQEPSAPHAAYKPERISAEQTQDRLAECGIWPLFWSSATGAMPRLGPPEQPRAIVINFVLSQPFRTRGKVIIRQRWEQVIHGIRFLARLLSDYGKIEIVLTEARDPLARKMQDELAGQAWVRLHSIPLIYPAENPLVLCQALRRVDPSIAEQDTVWVLDAQAAAAVGACLGEGYPLTERIVACGGPGHPEPTHLLLRVGTPLAHLKLHGSGQNGLTVLRGGLLTGEPVAQDAAVQYDDDAYFLLPEPAKRDFLGFIRPGFKKSAYLPCFATRITGGPDYIVRSIRGEKRPCIACGLCENVCPVGLLPQILHRYLYREAFEEAERIGLRDCVGCNLCTYVCPSKIELRTQFAETIAELDLEHEAALEGETPT